MSAKYQLATNSSNVVEKDLSGNIVRYIPDDSANTDWQAYQAWLADGNTPDPAP